MITADGNRFKSLANKKTEVEDDAKICIEQIVADALEHVDAHEHVTNTKNKAKRATANCVHGAAIGDSIALVIAAIQPVIVKSITVAVTSAVEAATEQIMANVRREMSVIEDVGKKRSSLQVETTNSALFMKLGSLLYVRCRHRSVKSTVVSNKTFLFQITNIYLFWGNVTLST